MPPVGNGHAPDFNGNTRKEKTSNYLGNTRDNHFLRHHQHCCIPVCFTNTQHSPNVVDRFADEEGRCRLDFPFNGTQKSFGGKRSPQSPGNLVKKNEEDIGVPTLAPLDKPAGAVKEWWASSVINEQNDPVHSCTCQ